MSELLINIVTAIVGAIAGGGGVLAFLNNRQQNKQNQHSSSITEWKELYDEMKLRLDEQERENDELRTEIFELRESVNKLTLELDNYKKYDSYINDLEKYVDHVLHTTQSLLNEEAYKNLCLKRPIRKFIEVE